ncbi:MULTISPECIES: hypothetical protein [unclassified Bartonella]|uniref:hypothetical protein n=1 Tax=unclassified Bartonella TaxID=2645622 RepID=UPI0035CFDF38
MPQTHTSYSTEKRSSPTLPQTASDCANFNEDTACKFTTVEDHFSLFNKRGADVMILTIIPERFKKRIASHKKTNFVSKKLFLL